MPTYPVTVGLEERLLNHPPTSHVQTLATRNPRMYAEEANGVCSLTPNNMVGTLVTELILPALKEQFRSKGLPMPERLNPPFTIQRGVQLLDSDPVTNTGMKAEQVLIKNACGRPMGVVLTGPLAGLTLDVHNLYPNYQRMEISRVWNDHQVYPGDLKAYTSFVDVSTGTTLSKGERQNLEITLKMLFHRACKDEIRRSISSGADKAWLSDVFFSLCNQLNIPVDTSLFHISRRKRT